VRFRHGLRLRSQDLEAAIPDGGGEAYPDGDVLVNMDACIGFLLADYAEVRST